MPRKRVLDPKIWIDDKFIELNSDEKLLFIGMMNFSDDRGIHKNNAKVLKIEIFPANPDIDFNYVEDMIKKLLHKQLVLISEDKKLLRYANWDVYQKIQHKTPSKYEDNDGDIIIEFSYYDNSDDIVVSPNINNINKPNIKESNINQHSLKKNTPSIKPKPYKDKVTEWYREFKDNEDKVKDFKETFPDVDIKQKLTECYTWLLKNVRKNYDKTFFNWCSNHTGRKDNSRGSNSYRYDSTGKFYVAYCSSCYRSDFYDPKYISTTDSRCCGSKLSPNKELVNGPS